MTVYATATAVSSLANNTDILIDELLGDFTSKPMVKDTPEDVFIRFFSGDRFGKIVILCHWLRVQRAIYDRAAAYNLTVAKKAQTLGNTSYVPVPFERWARVLIEHYLMESHPHWFIRSQTTVAGREPSDMGIVIDRLLTVDSIKREVFSKNNG